jgi:hypothetical protein
MKKQNQIQAPPSPGIACTVIPQARGSEVSLTIKPLPGEGIVELFTRLAVALKDLDATIVHLTVFGSISANAAGMEAMRRQFGKIDWPVTWIEGAACDGGPIAGLQVFGFAGGEVERIRLDGCVVGSVFNDGAARHCLLGGLGPVHNSTSRAWLTRCERGFFSKTFFRGMTNSTRRGRKFIPV